MTPSVVFTCSTFLSKPQKPSQVRTALSSIVSRHGRDELALLREIIVVNEYDPHDGHDYSSTVRSIHPGIEFVQKGANDRGQARTLNMILERIRDYEYWIHWEESWECTDSFVARALDVMQSAGVTQLQITPDWLDVGSDRILQGSTPAGTRYARILPHSDTARRLHGASIEHYETLVRSCGMGVAWPLFSLRPGVNRAAFCRNVGPFNEDTRHWPVRFEWDYSVRWFERGATKAVLLPHAARRQPNHVPTYR
jgi:hypothetical protein